MQKSATWLENQAALLTINGTDHISGHLKSKHSLITNPKSHSGSIQLPAASSSFESAARALSTPDGGHKRQPFWAAGYVQAYVDWTILQDPGVSCKSAYIIERLD